MIFKEGKGMKEFAYMKVLLINFKLLTKQYV